MTASVMLCVVLATVDSHVPEAHTENWVGGTSHISIHSLMWNQILRGCGGYAKLQ